MLVAALAGTSLTSASADKKDDLKDERGDVNNDINKAEEALDESSKRLVRTDRAYDAAKQQLSDARGTLSTTRGELKTAKAYDETMQQRLEDAEQKLEDAKQNLHDGQQRVKNAKEKAQEFLIEQATEGNSDLRALSSLLSGESSSDFSLRMDYTSAVNEAQTASLDNFDASAVMLELKRDKVEDARDEVAEQRRAAAQNLERKRELEKQAEQQEQQVETLFGKKQKARESADEAKQADLQRLNQLESERQRISNKLQQIAEQERQEALEEKQEQQEQQQNQTPPSNENNGNSGDGGSTDSDEPSDDGGDTGGYTGFSLGYPVESSYITSPYGMRLHPILGVYKLHDGTDFSAECGTPVVASEDGTVTDAYYNEGYGNRILINHGYHSGVSLATAYNHMTSFSVGPGQSVSKGQVIGYSGTTGYSTGCHMHFMVYENGATVDPMSWL